MSPPRKKPLGELTAEEKTFQIFGLLRNDKKFLKNILNCNDTTTVPFLGECRKMVLDLLLEFEYPSIQKLYDETSSELNEIVIPLFTRRGLETKKHDVERQANLEAGEVYLINLKLLYVLAKLYPDKTILIDVEHLLAAKPQGGLANGTPTMATLKFYLEYHCKKALEKGFIPFLFYWDIKWAQDKEGEDISPQAYTDSCNCFCTPMLK